MAALTMATDPHAGEVYIVDDDPAVRTTLSAVFTRAGYQVTCFADGAALVAAARIGTPVCIILDVHIPGKSGLDILKQLNAQDYPVPIFMMSGQGDIAMAVDAIKNGALDFIEKPFRGSDVIARVEAAIEARTQQEAGEAASETRRFYFPSR
jgi:FixJ family two-component response regulator